MDRLNFVALPTKKKKCFDQSSLHWHLQTFSCYPSTSSITPGRSSRLHPVFAHKGCMLGNSEVCIWLLFLLTPFTYLFVCQSCKGIKDGKDRDAFRLDFYFHGLWLLCGDECFPEPAEITALPSWGVGRILWNHFWQILSLRDLPCWSVFSGYVQQRLLLAGDKMHS